MKIQVTTPDGRVLNYDHPGVSVVDGELVIWDEAEMMVDAYDDWREFSVTHD